MKKFLLILLSLGLISLATISNAKSIRIGTEGAYPPWNNLNSAGELEGDEIAVSVGASEPYLNALYSTLGATSVKDYLELNASGLAAGGDALIGAGGMATYQSNFGAAAAGPLVVGLVLDLGGGINSLEAWGLGFASMGLVALLGPIGLWWYREK